MLKQSNQSMSGQGNLKLLARGIIISYIITIPLLALFALLLSLIGIPEKLMKPAVVITTIVSILIAALATGRSLKSKGWLNGGLVGFIYIFILYLLSSIVLDNFTIDRYVITMWVIGVLAGAIGGITGVNAYAGMRGRKRI